MKTYQIGENFLIKEYKDKKFAKWQIFSLIDGQEKSLGNCFDEFYAALIFIGMIARGCEINAANHYINFITAALDAEQWAKNNPVSHHYETIKNINDI